MVAVFTPQAPATGSGSSSTPSSVPVTTVSSAGSAQTFTFAATGNRAYDVTLSGACAITLTGGTAGNKQTITVRYNQPTAGGAAVSYSTAVRWPGGTAPTPNTTTGRVDVVDYATFGDGIYIGTVVGTGIYASAAAGTHVLNVAGGSASTPDTASLRAGAQLLDIKVKAAPTSWTPTNTMFMLAKWGAATANQEWVLYIQPNGTINFNAVISNGTTSTTTVASPGFANGTPEWLRVVVNPGTTASGSYAAGSTTIMTSPDGTTWTTQANTSTATSTAIQGTTSAVSIAGEGSNLAWSGTAYHATVAIGGTVVNDIDFTNQTTGATTLTATTGANWTVNSPANET